MGADDLDLARHFLAELEKAAKTGERESLYPLLAADVEWITPMRTLNGLDAVREQMIWGFPPENLELEFDAGETRDLGNGLTATDVHEVYRMKGTGDFAYARDLRIELTIRDGKVVRYEMRIVG